MSGTRESTSGTGARALGQLATARRWLACQQAMDIGVDRGPRVLAFPAKKKNYFQLGIIHRPKYA